MKLSATLQRELQNTIASIDAQIRNLEATRDAARKLLGHEPNAPVSPAEEGDEYW